MLSELSTIQLTPQLSYIKNYFIIIGQLKHEEKQSDNADTGFATVEESDIGKKNIERG